MAESSVNRNSRQPSPFAQRIYAVLRSVPAGQVTTYGDLAKACGTSPRAVGQAMRCNPYAPVVPCHRVVGAGGTIGGFMGKRTGKTLAEKIRRLKAEGVTVKNGEVVRFADVRHSYRTGLES